MSGNLTGYKYGNLVNATWLDVVMLDITTVAAEVGFTDGSRRTGIMVLDSERMLEGDL